MLGCNVGIDWKIIHTPNNKIKHIFEDGYEVSLDNEVYKNIVFDFTDQVEQFFINSRRKHLPTDGFDNKISFVSHPIPSIPQSKS
jgi:hypothetical protein